LPDSPRGVLITRPEPGASETARRVAAAGWEPVLAPMLELHPRPAQLPDPARLQAVLVTSASAVPQLPPAFHRVPIFAVGDATAKAAKRKGFADVASAEADAAALLRLVERRCRPAGGPLLLAVGAGQALPLLADLQAVGFRVHRRAVYAARPVRGLPREAREAMRAGTIAAALFFSPATGRAFERLMRGELRRAVAQSDAIVISAAVALAIDPLPWRRIRVASRPTQEQLLALLT
jgi:uroporphyrinogen-III synthase